MGLSTWSKGPEYVLRKSYSRSLQSVLGSHNGYPHKRYDTIYNVTRKACVCSCNCDLHGCFNVWLRPGIHRNIHWPRSIQKVTPCLIQPTWSWVVSTNFLSSGISGSLTPLNPGRMHLQPILSHCSRLDASSVHWLLHHLETDLAGEPHWLWAR